jgi:hypothetical protein
MKGPFVYFLEEASKPKDKVMGRSVIAGLSKGWRWRRVGICKVVVILAQIRFLSQC